MSISLTANLAEAQVIDLQNGVAVAGLAGAEGSAREYRLAVPAGMAALQVTISGGSGDCDLYVRHGERVTIPYFDYESSLYGNDETVTIANPDAGDWYIMLYGYDEYSGVTLRAIYVDQIHTITTLSAPPAGGDAWTDGDGTYGAGFSCTVYADPADGYNFLNWTEGGTEVSDSPDYTFTVTGDRTLTANFEEVSVSELTNWVAIEDGDRTNWVAEAMGLAGTMRGWKRKYRIVVPDGVVAIQVTTSGGSGDCDLLVVNEESGYWQSEHPGTAETVTITTGATAGVWCVTIYGVTAYSGVTLRATYSSHLHFVRTTSNPLDGGDTWTDGYFGHYGHDFQGTVYAWADDSYNFLNWTEDGTVVSTSAAYTFTVTGDRTLTANFVPVPVTDLQNGVAVAGLAGPENFKREYRLVVPEGAALLKITTSGGSGDCDLYVGNGTSVAQSSSSDYESENPGTAETVTIANPAAGAWYVLVYGDDAYAGVTLLVKYTMVEQTINDRFPPEQDVRLEAEGTFDGFVYGHLPFGGDALPALLGTLNVKVTDSADGKLTAKVTVQSGTVSFSGKEWTGQDGAGTLNARIEASGGEVLDLSVRQNRIWGTLAGGKFGGEPLHIGGARNRFADKQDAAAQAALNRYKGYYTATLCGVCREPSFVQGSLNAAPLGFGYLTLTVSAGGKVKIAGILADGTKVAHKSQLLWFSDDDEWLCAPFFVPLYRKTGYISGLFWINPATLEVYCGAETGESVRWEKPGAGPDGFIGLLDMWGSAYARPPALSGMYLFDAYLDYAGCAYHYKGGAATCLFGPEGVPVEVAGSKLKIARGVRPVKIREDGETSYEYGEVNPNMASLSFAARTGIFKGKYTLYYDYYDDKDRLQHKTVKVPYVGVMLAEPETGMVVSGYGHSLFPTKDPELKAYKIKPSFPVSLLTP